MSVSYRRDEAIAVISMDDGKVNALGPAMLGEITPHWTEPRARNLAVRSTSPILQKRPQ